MKYDLDKYYSGEYYAKRMAYKEKWYKVLAEGIAKYLKPTDILDFGCGNGVLGDGFNCPYVGIEGSEAGVKATMKRGYRAIKHDLRETFDLGTKANLVTSIEVAEHLEEEYADTYVDNLCKAGDTIVITASNEAGYSHFNLQPREYWIGKFEERGFEYDLDTNLDIGRELQKNLPRVLAYLYTNMMVFRRKTK